MTTLTQINADALKYVLSIPQGRKVIWDLLGIAGLYRQPRVAGDTEGTAFNCGGLNVGLALYADCLTVSPDLTAMMTREQATYDNREPNTGPEREYTSGEPGTDSSPELPGSLRIDRRTGEAIASDRPRRRGDEE